jgi:pimeloyl-ACP methyl ester carboxylesterase
MRSPIIFCFLLTLLLSSVHAQYYSGRIPVESELVLPPDYNPSISYPVVVMLPFTSGDAQYMFNAYAKEANSEGETNSEKLGAILRVFNAQSLEGNRSFVVLLPKGRGSRRDHSWQGFKACFERYEERIIKDLNKFGKTYNLDLSKVYLTGVSLGGDLSWALSQRHPEVFKGAMVMGSRCSYPPPDTAIEVMREKDYTFFMTMGMQEARDRLAGMRYARKILDSTGIQYVYKEMPELRHNKAPLWLFLEGMEYLIYNQTKSSTLVEKDASDLIVQLTGVYYGDIELNHYDIEEETDELMAEGNGLYAPYKTEFIEAQNLVIERKTNSRIQFQLQFDQLPSIEAYVSKTLDPDSGEEVIALTIPEQQIKGYKYRGTSIGLDDSKIHGMMSSEFLSLSFDIYKADRQEEYSTYTFFVILEN